MKARWCNGCGAPLPEHKNICDYCHLSHEDEEILHATIAYGYKTIRPDFVGRITMDVDGHTYSLPVYG